MEGGDRVVRPWDEEDVSVSQQQAESRHGTSEWCRKSLSVQHSAQRLAACRVLPRALTGAEDAAPACTPMHWCWLVLQ